MASECPLLMIPSEIRLLIYQFLFNLDLWEIPRLRGAYDHAAGCCAVNLHNERIYTRRKWGKYSFKNFSAILRTCHLINKEATDVLYEQTMFHIRISDEQYNRRMRPYAPLNECAFLPRIQQVCINPDVRQHEALLALPGILKDLFRLLTCAPAKTTVQFVLTSGCLSGFAPTLFPTEALIEEEVWEEFLEKISMLKARCRFLVNKPSVRNNVQERANQVVRAVDGWVVFSMPHIYSRSNFPLDIQIRYLRRSSRALVQLSRRSLQ